LANRFGSLDCGVESTIEISILLAWQHSRAMRHDGRRSGTRQLRAPNRACRDASWWSGQHEGTSFVARQDACACSGRRSMEPSERASNTTENVRDRSRFGKGSSSTSFGARRVSEQRSLYFHRARVFHRDDVDRSGRQRIAASPLLSLERELAGTERGTESPTEMPSAPRAQTEGS